MIEFKQSRVSQTIWPWIKAEQTIDNTGNCRKSGLIQFMIMMMVSLFLFFRFSHMAITILCIAIFLLITSLFMQKVFLAIKRGFKLFGKSVGIMLTWILLVPFFILVFVPGRICLLLLGKDPLSRKFPNPADSCWNSCSTRDNKSFYTKQYK